MASWIHSLFNRNTNPNQYSPQQRNNTEYAKYPSTMEELKLQQDILAQQMKLQQLQHPTSTPLDAAAQKQFNTVVKQHAPLLPPEVKTKHVFDSNKKFTNVIWPFKKVLTGEKRFNYEMEKSKKLIAKCTKKKLLTRDQWIKNEIDWRTQLIDLFGACVQYADQRILMTLEAEQKKKDRLR